MKILLHVEPLDSRILPSATPGLLGTVQGIAASPEAQTGAVPTPQAYQILLHRDGDLGGLAFYQSQLDGGVPQVQVDMEIANSVEFSAVHNTARDQVFALYEGLLGRSEAAIAADTAGTSFWEQNIGGDQAHPTTVYTLATGDTVAVPADMGVYGVTDLGIPKMEVTANLAPASSFTAAEYDVTYSGMPTLRMSGADARAFDSFIPDSLKDQVSYDPVLS